MVRPLKYETPEDLEEVFEDYLEDRIDPEKKVNFVSITDFCYFANMDRRTFYNYEQRSGYSPIIKRIRQFIYSKWEKQLFMPGQPDAGPIFWLKNFAGMADKIEHQHSGQIDHDHSSSLLDGMSEDQLQVLKSAADDQDQDQADDEVIDVTD